MKKLIALLLALVMTFSFASFAFAEEAGDTPTEDTTTSSNPLEDMSEEEILALITSMDFGTFKAIFKIAKIAVKLAFVMDKLGIIDLSPIKNAILDMVWDLIADYIQGEGDADTNTDTNTDVVAPALA